MAVKLPQGNLQRQEQLFPRPNNTLKYIDAGSKKENDHPA